MPGLAFLLLLAAVTRPFAEERLLLDRRLEALRRILPDGPSPEADLALVTDIARASHFAQPEVTAHSPTQVGERGFVSIEVKGQSAFGDVDRFFRQVALSPRLIDVETLTLDAGADNSVRFSTLLRVPYRLPTARLPPAPDGVRGRADVPRGQAGIFERDQAIALAKTEEIAALRRSRRNPRLFLSEISSALRDRPAVLSHARLADEFTLGGLVLGEAPLRALESRLERGFFRVSEFLVVSKGACHRFEARGVSPVVGAEAEIPLPSDDPFGRDEAPCRIDRDPGPPVFLRGPGGKLPGKGPLTLRLRDVDTADVFLALHLLTGRSFLVDADVRGRLSVEWDRMTLEDAFAQLQKATGLKIADAGGIVRVARNSVTARPPAPEGGSKGSFSLKRAEVRDVLRALGESEAALAITPPAGALGQVSLWARDVDLSDLEHELLDAAHLTDRVAAKAEAEAARAAPARALTVLPQEVTVSEFQLAGVISAGADFTALAYSPTGTLSAYRAGDRLADGTLTAVYATDVLLETDDGPLRLGLPLPR